MLSSLTVRPSRLVIHVIQKLRPTECESYLLPWQPADPDNHPDDATRTKIGLRSL